MEEDVFENEVHRSDFQNLRAIQQLRIAKTRNIPAELRAIAVLIGLEAQIKARMTQQVAQ
jgi:hypothetical protein